jgi:hypothetical protein
MATWTELTAEAPELAARIVARFGAHKHLLIATLRADGSPRISGIEAGFSRGELYLGMMPDSRKGADLRRDPRFALHSAPLDLELADGDAKLSGRAHLVTDQGFVAGYLRTLGEATDQTPPGDADLFRADVLEASIVTVVGDHLAIDSWRSGEGTTHRTRV